MKRREWNVTRHFTIRGMVSKLLLGLALALAAGIAASPSLQLPGVISHVEAVSSWSGNSVSTINRTSDRQINDDDRADADEDLLYYMQSLEVRYSLDEKVMENLHKVFDSAVYYIANTEMSVTELWSYVSQVKGNMESTAVAAVTMTTSEFLQVGDNWETPTVSYGQQVSIVLPVINFGTEELNNLIIEPQTSTVVTEWPFEPDMTSYLQTEPFIPGNQTKEAAMANRR
ncbi:MAG: hypothetical protein K2O13_01890, partial [Lachnospiraceae bacterium]|nr:hypothetical protein [Lachnospiraceae bacterium]